MQSTGRKIVVNIPAQRLDLIEEGAVVESFPVSTSAYGVGTEPGSLMTPPGGFRIAKKIGHGAEPWTLFKDRLPTGEMGSETAANDQVLTRILWLEGMDESNSNTRDRYIYIHGTNQESLVGQPASHGCIRMRNEDVIRLFDLVDANTEVLIET